jgi:hypothetical protein
MNQATPRVPPVVSEQLCIVYEQNTGRIIHAHGSSTLEGGEVTSASDLHARALERAAGLHKTEKRENMQVTSIDPKAFQPGFSYSIDPKTSQLVLTARKELGPYKESLRGPGFIALLVGILLLLSSVLFFLWAWSSLRLR